MGTDLVLTDLAFHLFGEVDCSKTTVKDGVVSSVFRTGKVPGFSEEAVQTRKRVRDVDGTVTTVTLEAVSVTSRSNVSRDILSSVRRDYDEYRRREGGRGEAERAGASGVIDVVALLEKDLL